MLYRRTGRAVIPLALGFLALSTTAAQVTRGKVDKGPRAVGLLALSPNGKAHLIPVAIMVDGQFYDASAYKASPVPMALWSEVVYEAEKSGVSQGLFTVSDALQNKQTGEWMAEGKWQTKAALEAAAKKSAAPPTKPRGLDDDSGPPVLRHAGAKKPAAPAASPGASQTGSATAAAAPASPAPSSGTSQTTSTQTASPPSAARTRSSPIPGRPPGKVENSLCSGKPPPCAKRNAPHTKLQNYVAGGNPS